MFKKLKKQLSKAPSYRHWQKVGIKHHHGFCLPLFSLRSKNSCGIGEFTDLRPLIDWCFEIGMDLLQLLPLNESDYREPSPYNSLSSCALDPIFLGFTALPFAKENEGLQKKMAQLKKYNEDQRVKHDLIRKKKMQWLEEYYVLYFVEYFQKSPSFKAFQKKNKAWLKPYAVFRFLKDKFKGKKWPKWPKHYQNPNAELIDSFWQRYPEELNFYSFVQYLCYDQMEKIKKHATKKHVLLVGDIPILINADSVDVWYWRDIFEMKKEAGAPPDKFAAEGQRWKFPILNWAALKKKKYFWWKQKLFTLSSLCHIYRIDHSVGLFRIWAIDLDKKAIKGKFLPEDIKQWSRLGEEHLKMLLKASPLLPIAEDLGFIPEMVFKTLKKLGICGTKVLRWHLANPLSEYEPLSVAMLSTHDMQTLKEWWVSHKEEARLACSTNKWEYRHGLPFKLRKKILFDLHRSSSLFHINLLQEYLALFPELVWKMHDERINIPASIGRKNWAYRFKPSIEEIISHKRMKNNLKKMISGKS